MTAPELKPCPRGCSQNMLSVVNMSFIQFVECTCGWNGPAFDAAPEAIAAWNHRAAHPVTVEVLKRWADTCDAYEAELTAAEIRAAIAQMGDGS